ncbi:DUF4199 family protein [Aquimarina aggregata]|uniref:DUF4199 family protein n=1 Tax=Aquimarina aggregata TaxID=1642818 RepID=UPI00249345D3|nr:DUF4199 family protein [Aquimarina aggregata]
MQPEGVSTIKYSIKYGLIQAFFLLGFAIISYLYPNFTLLNKFYLKDILIFIIPLFLGVKAYKSDNGGFLTIGDAVKIGVGIYLISSILYFIWLALYSEILQVNINEKDSPEGEMILSIPEISPKELIKKLEDDRTISFIPFFWHLLILILQMLVGTCLSVITGIILYKKKEF